MPRCEAEESSNHEESDSGNSSSYDSSEDQSCSDDEPKSTRKRRIQSLNHYPEKRMRKEGSQGVYVLRNTNTNELYVGKSSNIDNRIRQHKAENGRGLLVREQTMTTGSTNDLESWERNEVLTRMYRHGMDSVRGWRYTTRGALAMDNLISARNDIIEKFDLCRRCGRNSHFADRCFARSPAFWCKDIPM